MVTYYCCGCRAEYPAPLKRCQRCKGRSFSAVNDDAPTAGLLNAPAFAVVAPVDMDDELREAWEASERFRLGAISGRPAESSPGED